METVETVVIGAGVIGLAVAREVLVLEAADAIGTGNSSRNSEVIHAGICYPPGSLKARLCVAGKHLLYEYCRTQGGFLQPLRQADCRGVPGGTRRARDPENKGVGQWCR